MFSVEALSNFRMTTIYTTLEKVLAEWAHPQDDGSVQIDSDDTHHRVNVEMVTD